ncbi:hypothetical protein ACTWP6_18915 [Mycobacterium sp. 4D054]|uniref:hypothetical protein n=1 Tax=unclassified Mycobacterium TaxID=2642494 RepID=UPI0021B4CA27|nr:hypothetical protein [Mycobacterium sp. SMC-8]UXA12346.1 hypothetical protein KXD97_31455 [Mycobacterium sp. SMC-8]UXA12365.1 hypothetical protein KXD97_00075 [Mycobacterium sp. SMC-8]
MPPADRRPSSPWLRAARVFAVLTLGVVVMMFVTAGEIVQYHRFEDLHGAGAIALHVTSGGLLVGLTGLALDRKTGWWAAVLAGALFVFTFVQAAIGEATTLALHVPGALAVTAATVWLTAWVFYAADATGTARG